MERKGVERREEQGGKGKEEQGKKGREEGKDEGKKWTKNVHVLYNINNQVQIAPVLCY